MTARADVASSINAGRRDFLKAAILAAGAGSLAAAGVYPRSAWAAEPASADAKPQLKLSLAAYSFHRDLPYNWPKPHPGAAKMNLDEFIAFCAQQKLDGCELTSYYFPRPVTPEYLAHLKELTSGLGLEISGTAVGNDFCVRDEEARNGELELMRLWIDYAAAMGAPHIRIFAGSVPEGETEEAARERCIDGINASVEYAAKKKVILGLENHGGITATPEQLLKIVDGVKPSPWFGVNFDSGNFNSADPYADLEKIAPHTVNAQIKVEMSVNGKKEPADFNRVIRILKDAGYRRYIVLEYESEEDPKTAIPGHLTRLREAIEKA